MAETGTVALKVDTDAFEDSLKDLEKLAARFGTQMLGALRSATVGGRELEDVLRGVGLKLADMALAQGLAPLGKLIPGAPALLQGLTGLLPFAKGGVPGLTPFASGGVVSGPTLFPMARGLGLMGESGAEAILPLQRSADGRLGVAASGGGGGGVSVVFNVSSPDAASFRKSEAQITGMLARAVSRGARTM